MHRVVAADQRAALNCATARLVERARGQGRQRAADAVGANQAPALDRGLLDFPARHEGRTVHLCWQEGEDGIEWFHEVEDGFAGRRPVTELDGGVT